MRILYVRTRVILCQKMGLSIKSVKGRIINDHGLLKMLRRMKAEKVSSFLLFKMIKQ